MNIILVLADDRSIVESLRAMIPKTDLLVIEKTVNDALRRMINLRADVVLIDDARGLGMDALRELGDATPTAPVIMLASTGHAETIASYTLAGARGCLVKPFSLDALEDAIEKCVTPNEPATPIALSPTGPPTTADTLRQHQTALRWMSRGVTHTEDTSRLVQNLTDALVDIFDAVRTAVLLQTNGTVRVVANHGIPASIANAVRLTFSAGLMHRLERDAGLIDRDRLDANDPALKELQVLGARIAAPLLIGGRTCGALLLGEKASGAAYGNEEFDLLTTVARFASTGLEGAQRHRDSSRQQARLDAVLANITAGVVTVAPDYSITMINESAERVLRVNAQDILGRSVQKLGSAFADVVLKTLREGKPRLRQKIRDVAIAADLGLSVTPMGSEGAVAIFSTLPVDEKEEEDTVFSPIWQFLADRVAQEIKNPMVAINTFAQLLPTSYDSEEFRTEFSEVVQGEVARINHVIEALYEFAGPPRPDLQPRNLNENVDSVLDEFESTLAEKNIELEKRLSKDKAKVRLDVKQFALALRNVLQNAVEAMPDGGKIIVATQRENGGYTLAVSDTGEGIQDKDAPLVFTPFFSTKETGMGLGLTMANRILREHDGTLELTTDPDGGETFVFHLPVEKAN